MRRDQIEELFYGKPEQQRRFTQDFPALPDVWIAYGQAPGRRVELLLTPHTDADAAGLARALRRRLGIDSTDSAEPARKAGGDPADRPRVLFNESVVLAWLSFRELVCDAMPLTDWWKRIVTPIGGTWQYTQLRDFASTLGGPPGSANTGDRRQIRTDPRLLQKLITIVGCIELERAGRPDSSATTDGQVPSADEVDAFARLFDGLQPVEPDALGLLWSISVNRQATTSVWRSRLTVKADAASQLFQSKSSGIRWAVLDTGIDATHKAFERRDQKGGRADSSNGEDQINSRVIQTYDFMGIKDLLDPTTPVPVEGTAAARIDPVKLDELRADLQSSLKRGRAIDWDLLEPFLRVPHTAQDYRPPKHDGHGTHVAGILAANWREAADETPLTEPLVGICPDLELYDMRVLPDDPKDRADEFTIIAALQFIRHLNAHKNLMVVHGVNLSLSLPHDVANYACGRTPVCDECERVVDSGVIVVTAAGNRGFNEAREPTGGAMGDYRYISITDPGNAESVITVGSTHRMMPHTYGVSYFSSRGPTGDGRTKPDLIAPGERIDSCSLNGYYETMDGTSMAAPHVSGAAALLISRHRELIGQPRRVKEILCNSATDLGREPRFQGRGMVDVLRAIQSV
jgi:serine protease AprX